MSFEKTGILFGTVNFLNQIHKGSWNKTFARVSFYRSLLPKNCLFLT